MVLGIGKGTLAVIIFAIFGIAICLFRDSSATPNLCVFLGILLPLIVLLIIALLPKRSLQTDKEQNEKMPTDNYLLWKLLITIAMGLVLLLLACVIFGTNMSIELIASRAET